MRKQIFQKKIFSFGGYGLFTDKNNLTYFDNSTKEWFDYNYFPNETQPTPRRLAISKVIESDLYVFGGFQKKINEQLDVYTEHLQDLWRLDLNSHGWEYCGETTISDLLDKKIDLIEANKKAEEFIKSYEKFDYFEFRNVSNLSLEGSLSDSRLFYAIYKSGVRLIDNLEI